MTYYPAMLDLRGRKAVVIGGGVVAARKVRELVSAGASVTVVAPRLGSAIRSLAAGGAIEWKRRRYRRGDLAGARLAVIATDDVRVQRRGWSEAEASGVFVNTVDEPARCSFITPAVVRRPPLTIAISTGGTNPGIARALRERLERHFGAGFGTLLRIASRERQRLRARGVTYADRTVFARDVTRLADRHIGRAAQTRPARRSAR